MSIDDFKKQHGAAFAKLIHGEALPAAMQAVEENAPEMQLLGLSDDDIEKHSAVILARLQGFLSYSHQLRTVLDRKDFTAQEPLPDYPDPIAEAATLSQKQK